MKSPAQPNTENARLASLKALNVLDTAPEERFDRITRLAKRLFNVPIVLISLIDSDRQWFKSTQGLNASETSRDISFCGHTILKDEIMVVSNVTEDARFHDNPLVTSDPAIRFYAGCPLTLSNGDNIGTLCLIDQHPREMTEEDSQLLTDLARMVTEEFSALQLATTDSLTGLSNRRGFELLAQHALSVSVRKETQAALLLFDLNDFKRINDTYGHCEGDLAIARFGQSLKETFRDSDIIARLGGDEFTSLLTGSQAYECTQALLRLDAALHKHNQQSPLDYDISYSVGCLEFNPQLGQSLNTLLEKADRMMYMQKTRNRASTKKNNSDDYATLRNPARATGINKTDKSNTDDLSAYLSFLF